MSKIAIIIGAGPAGLTAAYELLRKTDITPIVYEATNDIGGISKTINYKGNRIDLGGHRFFSKSERVMKWWLDIMPLQGFPSRDDVLLGRKIPLSTEKNAPDPEKEDRVFLFRNRLSRIFFLKKFFDYPLAFNFTTVSHLGILRIIKIGISYLKIRLFPIKPESSLADFFTNRFGYELYATFFKDYTEKVWGIPCDKISAEWGAQRVKGLSVMRALRHLVRHAFLRKRNVDQKKIEATLIEHFLFPKFGSGQLWETVAEKIQAAGGEIHLKHRVVGFNTRGNEIHEAKVNNDNNGREFVARGDYFFSTMPVKELIAGLGNIVPAEVKSIAQELPYRDFMTVGLLLNKLKIENTTRQKTVNNIIPDHWLYVQERDVKLGRIQIFNNWSPYMVNDSNTVWIGLEYFCNEGDTLWNKSDREFADFAIDELTHIAIIDKKDVIDRTVIRMPKAYPAYFGSYDKFGAVKEYLDSYSNLFLIGRNGMHRYSNQDHSMLSAMVAVENVMNGITCKDTIWAVTTERNPAQLPCPAQG